MSVKDFFGYMSGNQIVSVVDFETKEKLVLTDYVKRLKAFDDIDWELHEILTRKEVIKMGTDEDGEGIVFYVA